MTDANSATRQRPRENRGSAWSVQIGTVLGIPIRIHFTFLLLLLWFGFASSRRGEDAVQAILFLVLLFACVALHELGHAAMAGRFGVRTHEIVLYPIGGVARLDSIPQGKAELLITLAGPAVNLVLAAILVAVILAVGMPLVPSPEAVLAPGSLLHRLLAANVALVVFNLIPAFPMDGGRVLRAALALAMPADRATTFAATVGQGIALLGGALGALSGNWLLVFIAVFVFLGASQESAFFRQRAVVIGRATQEAMITRFDTLGPQDTLGRAAELLLATHQQDFPVVDARGRVAGILSRTALMTGLAKDGASAAVLDIMEPEVPSIGPAADLEEALRLFQSDPGTPVLVLEGERLVGMITFENLAEFIQIAQVSNRNA